VAFAPSPVTGPLIGVLRREQPMDARTVAGLLAILAGIVLLQIARRPGPQ
jgi:multidrug transporter EmrE-like cation transporter